MNEEEKRFKIISIAKAEIGISESPANSNKVKYNTWFYNKEVQDGFNLKGEKDINAKYPWCGTCMSWIFAHGTLPLGNIGYLKGYAGCPYAVANIAKWGKEVSFLEAKPGDLIFYDWNIDGKWDHTGLLYGKHVNNKSFQAIEGNTSKADKSNGGSVMLTDRIVFPGLKFVRPNVYNS